MKPRLKLLRGGPISLHETACILLEEFIVAQKKARMREKFVSILFTHLSRYTPYRADIFTSDVIFVL